MTREILIGAAVVGLAVNLYGDVMIWNQNKSSIAAGEWVERSNNISRTLDQLKIEILESQIEKTVNPRIHDDIHVLNELLVDAPAQQSRAEKLAEMSDQEFLAAKPNAALSILAEMTAIESALLHDRARTDNEINQEGLEKALVCNSVDIMLIFLFVGGFAYERRSGLRLRAAVTRSLIDSETINVRLRQAIQKHQEKLKTTVHDLKNPLGSIRGFAEILHDSPSSSDSVAEMSKIIHRVSDDTLSLVSTLLNEKDQDFIKTERLGVLKCLKDTCKFLEPIAGEKDQKLIVSDTASEFEFMGAKLEIQDVFFNLVGNALKFSPKGSSIHLDCHADPNFYSVVIKDQGPGFTEDDFAKLFRKGAKLSAKPTGNEVSTGLGLFSAKQSIEKFGGAIEVANDSSGGARITVKFPALN